MNRTALFNSVARDFGYPDVGSSPAAAITNRIYAYLNDHHRRLASLPGAELLRRETGPSITLTASTAVYGLMMPIERVLQVVDTTNDRVLQRRDLDWYRMVDPDPATCTQEFWIPLRYGAAVADCGSTGIWAVSSSASDTAVNVHVETIDAVGNHTASGAVTLTGTTRVQIGTATNHQRVVQFSADSTPVGYISLYNASSSGTEVSRISLGRTVSSHLEIALWPTPAAADTIVVDYVHHIRDFNVAYDEPQLPEDFHYLVALGAKMDEALKKEDLERFKYWSAQYEDGKRKLIHWLANPGGGEVIVPGVLDQTGRSNLGGAFPAGVW